MKPVRLEVEGFLSYRDRVVVDFDGLEAVAIVGDNGAGKTSLIEALTWVLFGESRSGRLADGVVNAASSKAQVDLVFEAAGGGLYRVVRTRELTAGGKTSLFLFGSDGATIPGGTTWVPLAGDKIADVQAKIIEVLGLTAETWTSTSFIGQGRADQFTRLTPAGRKDLLADVLELGRFQDWSERFRAMARTERAEVDADVVRIQSAQEVVDAVRDDDLATVEAAIEAADAKVDHADQELAHARRALDDVERADADVARIEAARTEAGRRRYAALEAARTAVGEAIGRLNRAQSALMAAVDARVRAEHDAAKVPDVRRTVAEHEATLADATSQAVDAEGRAGELAERLAGDQVSLASGRDARTKIAGRRDTLTAAGPMAATCPVCGGPLDPESYDRLVGEVEDELDALDVTLADLSKTIDRRTSELTTVRAAAANARQSADRVQRLLDGARADLARAEVTAGTVPDLADRVHAAEEAVRDAREVVDVATKTRDDLDQPGEDEQRLAAELAEAQARAMAGTTIHRLYDEQRSRLAAAREDAARLGRELGRAQEAAQRAQDARDLITRLVAQRDARTAVVADLDALAAYFGRDGLQAWLVDQVVPDLEAEANAVLDAQTAGKFRVRIDTTRVTKGGEEREALDLVVSDDVSDRPLEALSGGERQMVDLAVRYALSALLAHRAGRRVGTLVIDEGFTALDAAHRQRTIEALRAVVAAGRFGLVLFVTHLADLADAFPDRILVSRGPDGGSLVVAAPEGAIA